MGAGKLSFRSKSQAVEEYLRAKIRNGEIKPGERLRQDLLAEELGVSATPVREALRRLEADGLVLHIANKGVTASGVTQHEVREIFPLRILLEGYATRQATTQLSEDDLELLSTLHRSMVELEEAGDRRGFSAVNDRWHSIIYHAAGSMLLEKTIHNIWKLTSVDDLWIIPGRSRASLVEHERILRALQNRDPDEAGMAMEEHLRIGERFLLDFIRTQPASNRRQSAWK